MLDINAAVFLKNDAFTFKKFVIAPKLRGCSSLFNLSNKEKRKTDFAFGYKRPAHLSRGGVFNYKSVKPALYC